ncbi:MAG TPA: hypothetical protein VFV38_16455 [Ktedonobacteraceae bacterium]|nr:hypothetical protein [Ktedonobacteraceae bacterium]
MSRDGVLTLLTPVYLNQREYEDLLKQLDAKFLPGDLFDASVTRGSRCVWFTLKRGDQLESLWTEEEDREQVVRLLGSQPQSGVQMIFNEETGSENIAIDFALLFAALYPCVLRNNWMDLVPPEEFVDCAEPGYDGYRLDATRTHVVKGAPETAEEKRKRLARVRREKVLVPGALTDAVFTMYLGNPLSDEELTQALAELGAEILLPRGFYAAQIIRDGRKVLIHVSPPADFQRRWNELAPRDREAAERVLGGAAHGLLDLHAVKPLPSVNMALDFMVAFEKRYRCVVQDGSGEIHSPAELLEFAQPGFDGYRWDAEQQMVMKDEGEA